MGTEGFASQVLLGRECVGGKGNDSINMTQPACIGSWFLFDTGALREAAGLRYKGEDCNLEKLLYFYPDNTPGDDMKDRVGCCEALITFTSVFSPDKPCSAVHLEKQRHAYLQCEPGVWCVMEVNNPIVMTNGEPVLGSRRQRGCCAGRLAWVHATLPWQSKRTIGPIQHSEFARRNHLLAGGQTNFPVDPICGQHHRGLI